MSKISVDDGIAKAVSGNLPAVRTFTMANFFNLRVYFTRAADVLSKPNSSAASRPIARFG